MQKTVRATYYWTLINIFVFVMCFFLWLTGIDIDYPDDWKAINIFSIMFSFFYFSLSPLLCLYMREKFDLICMKEGKSIPSQWIWVMLGILVNMLATLTLITGVRELTGTY